MTQLSLSHTFYLFHPVTWQKQVTGHEALCAETTWYHYLETTLLKPTNSKEKKCLCALFDMPTKKCPGLFTVNNAQGDYTYIQLGLYTLHTVNELYTIAYMNVRRS